MYLVFLTEWGFKGKWLFSSGLELYRLPIMNKLSLLPILICFTMLPLAGCGFQPMYGDYSASADKATPNGQSSEISIDIIPDREGQILRNHLIDKLYQNGYPNNPTAKLHIDKLEETKTELDLTKSSEATRAQLRLKTNMVLTDISTGKVILNRSLQTISSYNILESEFATRVTEESARQSAINDIARQIELNLSLYTNSQ